MYFTREPLIETVMTPREGYKLVVRSTRNAETEEYFVDALEVVSFGQALFFRSMERPKCFLVPVSDYEVMEVRETRLILKAAPLEKGIKIGGGREAPMKSQKEVRDEKLDEEEIQSFDAVDEEDEALEGEASPQESPLVESKLEKRRERRRHRRRKTKGDEKEEVVSEPKATLAVDDISESYANGLSDDPLEEEKPFLLSEEILMLGAKKGIDRQLLHEKLRSHCQSALYEIKVRQKPNNLLELIQKDPMFEPIKDSFASLWCSRLSGRSTEQVEDFVESIKGLSC